MTEYTERLTEYTERLLMTPFGLASRSPGTAHREFFIDNLLFRIHLIIEMILVDRPCVMGV